MPLDRSLLVMAVALVTLAPAAGTMAQGGGAGSLDEVREMILYARYDEAIPALESHLARADLGAVDRNAALELLAIAQVANRSEAGARSTLELLYSRDPDYRLTDPDASPLVQAAFSRARGQAPDPVLVELRLVPSAGATQPMIAVILEAGADAVHEIRISYRLAEEGRYAGVTTSVEGAEARARIPRLGGSRAHEVEYYVEALAPSGSVLGALGTRAEPLAMEVAASGGPLENIDAGGGGEVDSDGSVLGAWWFWTGIAVLVGGGIAAYMLLGPPSESLSDGSLGTVTLR